MPKVSVIVPVYNVEQYLPTTIDSILSQTFTDFELILVDDGSKDSSGLICDNYAKRDSRIKTVHVPNGGAAEARNHGLDNAISPFITFIDSDDYIEPKYLQVLMEELVGFDLLVAEHIKCTRADVGKLIIPQYSERTEINNCKEFTEKFYLVDTGFLGQPISKIFSKNIIDKYHIRFRKIQSEDEIFVFNYLMYAETIKKIDYKGYLYIQNSNSLSQRHSTLTELNWIHLMVNYYSVLNEKYLIFRNHNYYELFQVRMLERYYWFLLKGYYKDTYQHKTERINRWRQVRQDDLFKKIAPKVIISKLNNRFARFICLAAKYRLWYIVDPVLNKYMKINRK